MEILNIIAGVVLLVVVIVGAALKRYTKRTLSDIDGMGEVTKNTDDSNIVAKL